MDRKQQYIATYDSSDSDCMLIDSDDDVDSAHVDRVRTLEPAVLPPTHGLLVTRGNTMRGPNGRTFRGHSEPGTKEVKQASADGTGRENQRKSRHFDFKIAKVIKEVATVSFYTRPLPLPGLSRAHDSMGARSDDIGNVQQAKTTDTVLIFPRNTVGAVTIKPEDVARLDPGECLNDVLIEFGLKYILSTLRASEGICVGTPAETGRRHALQDEILLFSSYLYQKLNAHVSDKAKEDVKRWTRKHDIFTKKYVVVPINEGNHWYLAIIYQPEYVLPRTTTTALLAKKNGHTQEEVDVMEVDTATGSAHHGSKGLYREQNQVSEDEVNELLANKASAEVQASVRGGMANSKTYIFVFDSSGEGRQAASNKLSDFLIAEAWDKRGIRSEQIISPEYMRVKVPLQHNNYDCGVYLLHFAEKFLKSPTRYIAAIIPERRPPKEDRDTLWAIDEVAQKRKHMAQTIGKLSAEWQEQRLLEQTGRAKSDEESDDEITEVHVKPKPTPRLKVGV